MDNQCSNEPSVTQFGWIQGNLHNRIAGTRIKIIYLKTEQTIPIVNPRVLKHKFNQQEYKTSHGVGQQILQGKAWLLCLSEC